MLSSPVPIVTLWHADGYMIYTEAYSVFAGARHPRLLGSRVLEGWHEVADFNRHVLEVVLAGGTLSFTDQELTLFRNERPELLYLDLDYSPIVDKAGKPVAVMAIVLDQTIRVTAERERDRNRQSLVRLNAELEAERAAVTDANLRLSDETEFLRGLFAQAPGFMAVMQGPRHVFALANEPYLELTGHRELIGLPFADAMPEAAEQGFAALLDEVYRTGKPYSGRSIVAWIKRSGDGPLERRSVDFVFQPIRAISGLVVGIFVEGTDVTERFVADERLRIAQRAGEVGAFEWYPETGRVEASDEYRSIWGLAAGTEITSELLVSLVHADDRGQLGPSRIDAANPLQHAEYRIVRPDNGETRWIARRGEVIADDGVGRRRFVGVAFDITDRKRRESAREESEVRFRLMADSAPALIWACDETGHVTFANRRFETEFGISTSEVLDQGWRRVVHEDDVEQIKELLRDCLQTQVPFRADVRVRDRERRQRWLRCDAMPRYEADGRFVGLVGVNVDVTDAKLASEALEVQIAERAEALSRAEEALRQAQKMEAIGQLTGGIAHDFNNLLTGIIGSLDLLQRKLRQGRIEDSERFVAAATASANRAAALTHRLLAFSRRQPLNPRPVEGNRLRASIEDLLRRTIGEQIALEIVQAGALWRTSCDPNQLESSLLNLVINARDAMPDGGRITIETSNAHLDNAYAANLSEIAPGQYVCISVTDTGTGMSAETIKRAFEPFYTTKPMGQGTGLGLSMVYGFARQSEGYARIYSEIGVGTTIKLYLPRFRGEMPEEQLFPDAEAGDAPAADGVVVMVVEDESTVRDLVIEVLHDAGYQTIEAEDGPSGLRLLESNVRVDLLVTDVGLPGLNGRQLADAARRSRGELPVLFMTGYAENAFVADGALEPGMDIITKPFALDVLAARVAAMTARPAQP
ncbi:PAS domain-containing protein [soil metagenome]